MEGSAKFPRELLWTAVVPTTAKHSFMFNYRETLQAKHLLLHVAPTLNVFSISQRKGERINKGY